MKEFDNNRKLSKGVWTHSRKAAHVVGATIYPPRNSSSAAECFVELPADDATFSSFPNQPANLGEGLLRDELSFF